MDLSSAHAQTLLSRSASLTPRVSGCFPKPRSVPQQCPPFGLVPTQFQPTNSRAASLVARCTHLPFSPASATRFAELPHSWKSWVSDDGWVDGLLHSNRCGDFFTAEDASSQIWPAKISWGEARKALSILYRALLIGAVGLSFSSPVFARPAVASETSVASPEKVMESDLQKQEASETGASKSSVGFDDAFWTDLEKEKDNSIQLTLKKYLEGHPTNIEALECLAHLLVEKNDMKRALKVFEKLELLDPEELEWKYMKAQALEFTGELELAKKGFEELLRLQPFSSRALQGLVIVMSRIGEGGSAMGVLEASVARARQENKMVEARNLRMLIGQFHTMKGNLQEALQHYKELIDEDPDDFRPYLCEGIIYSVLGEKDLAELQFTNYRKLCPKDFPNREFLDELMLKAKNEGATIYDLKQKASADDAKGKDKDMTNKQSSDKSESESLGK